MKNLLDKISSMIPSSAEKLVGFMANSCSILAVLSSIAAMIYTWLKEKKLLEGEGKNYSVVIGLIIVAVILFVIALAISNKKSRKIVITEMIMAVVIGIIGILGVLFVDDFFSKHSPTPSPATEINSSEVLSTKATDDTVSDVQFTPISKTLEQHVKEPDKRDEAELIESYSGSVSKVQSSHIYELEIDNDGIIWIEFKCEEDDSSFGSWKINLSNADEDIVESLYSTYETETEPTVVGVKAGDYKITVERQSGEYIPYTINIYHWMSDHIEIELNDVVENATKMDMQEEEVAYVYGNLSKKDQDYYKIELPEESVFACCIVGDDAQFNVNLYNAQSEKINSLITLLGGSFSEDIRLSAGTYYIGVENALKMNDMPYVLEAMFYKPVD